MDSRSRTTPSPQTLQRGNSNGDPKMSDPSPTTVVAPVGGGGGGGGRKKKDLFPVRLHRMIDECSKTLPHVADWCTVSPDKAAAAAAGGDVSDNRDGFIIFNMEELRSRMFEKYGFFDAATGKVTLGSSIMKQLRNYGFKRANNGHHEYWYHPTFRRHDSNWSHFITLEQGNGGGGGGGGAGGGGAMGGGAGGAGGHADGGGGGGGGDSHQPAGLVPVLTRFEKELFRIKDLVTTRTDLILHKLSSGTMGGGGGGSGNGVKPPPSPTVSAEYDPYAPRGVSNASPASHSSAESGTKPPPCSPSSLMDTQPQDFAGGLGGLGSVAGHAVPSPTTASDGDIMSAMAHHPHHPGVPTAQAVPTPPWPPGGHPQQQQQQHHQQQQQHHHHHHHSRSSKRSRNRRSGNASASSGSSSGGGGSGGVFSALLGRQHDQRSQRGGLGAMMGGAPASTRSLHSTATPDSNDDSTIWMDIADILATNAHEDAEHVQGMWQSNQNPRPYVKRLDDDDEEDDDDDADIGKDLFDDESDSMEWVNRKRSRSLSRSTGSVRKVAMASRELLTRRPAAAQALKNTMIHMDSLRQYATAVQVEHAQKPVWTVCWRNIVVLLLVLGIVLQATMVGIVLRSSSPWQQAPAVQTTGGDSHQQGGEADRGSGSTRDINPPSDRHDGKEQDDMYHFDSDKYPYNKLGTPTPAPVRPSPQERSSPSPPALGVVGEVGYSTGAPTALSTVKDDHTPTASPTKPLQFPTLTRTPSVSPDHPDEFDHEQQKEGFQPGDRSAGGHGQDDDNDGDDSGGYSGDGFGLIGFPELDAPFWWQVGFDIIGHDEWSHLGTSIAMSYDGQVMAVGSPGSGAGGHDAGMVEILEFNATSLEWQLRGHPIYGAALERVGSALALSGDGMVAAVGGESYSCEESGLSCGRVRVFRYMAGQWTLIFHLAGLVPSVGFGRSVALNEDGTVLLLGSPRQVGSTTPVGMVRALKFNATSGRYEYYGQDEGEIWGEWMGESFGQSVQLSATGTRIAVASPNNAMASGFSTGRVLVYQYDESDQSWFEIGEIEGEDLGEKAGYGLALSPDGSTVAMGAPMYSRPSTPTDHSGAVRVYRYDEEAKWMLMGEAIVGTAGDLAGAAVALSYDGSHVIVGSDRFDEFVDMEFKRRSGRACVYEYRNVTNPNTNSSIPEWYLLGDCVAGEEADQLGGAVAMGTREDNVTIVAVGAKYHDGDYLRSSGRVQVFEYN